MTGPSIVEEVQAYLRDLASGVAPDVGVQDDETSDAALGRQLELALERFARCVRHKDKARPGDFYVGRPTLWGNSRRLPKGGGTAEDRRQAVLAYARELRGRSDAQRSLMVGQVRQILQRGSKLVCWCAPKLCHAQVLAAWALEGDPLRGIEGRP